MRDYSSHAETAIAYCDDVTEVRFGEGREVMQVQRNSALPVSRHDVREYNLTGDIS